MYNDPSVIFFPFCCGIVFFFLLFLFLVVWRYLQYRETIALAEKGLLKPSNGGTETPGRSQGLLISGVVLATLGLALTIGLWPIGISDGLPLGISPWMIFGFIPLFGGLGLILVHLLTRGGNNDGAGKDKSGPAS
jgi:hypothetical protein